MQSGYAVIARVRAKELRTRLALGLFLAGTAYVLAPSVWPLAWFAVMAAGQAVDWLVFRPFRADPQAAVSRPRAIACALAAALNTTIYSAIGAYAFLQGGDAGKLFGVIQAAGGLLHVSLHMHHVRSVLAAAAAPHAAYLLLLPVAGNLTGAEFGTWPTVGVVVAGLLYIGHLVVAVKQAAATTSALRVANTEAEAQKERAERASAAKSDFLATVSHEIRTPMNAVISAAILLKRTDLTPQQAEHVAMLLNAGDVLMGLLNDVLDLSKIEAGKMELEETDVDLHDKLEALVLLWTPKARAKGVALELEVADDLPRGVRTDPLRLQQILFNLLSNAVKFTDTGRVVVRARHANGRLVVEVEDTGCGIAPEALGRLFESFAQAEATVTRRVGGTGLGLAIGRRLADLMGGSLTVTSCEGQGSCFRLELPLRAAAPAAAEPDASPTTDTSRPLSVLVAEDHEVNQRILELFLEPLGWRLTQAWNGQEAVAAAARQPFDVILMDMQMPVMNGPDATAAIRAGGGLNAATPIVALTAAALDHHRQTWAAVGVDLFLTKPIQPQLLIETLSAAAEAARPPALQAAA